MDEGQLAIFLSPHFDDIPLSCAGIGARLSRMGVRCVGLVVCAAPAPTDGPLSDYARALHARWEQASGTTMQAINEVRREEERQAMSLLGLEPVWLDIPDAIYRRDPSGRHYYTSDEQLFGRVAPLERRLLVPRIAAEIRRVAKQLGGRGRVRVFAPLGVGHHVDHQLVFRAARRLGPRFGVLFYEDYPYAAVPGALQARLSELAVPAPPRPRLLPISELIGLKIAAIARYKSQLSVLFGSAEAMPPAVRAYAGEVARQAGLSGDSDAGVHYAERYWQMPPVYTLGGARRES